MTDQPKMQNDLSEDLAGLALVFMAWHPEATLQTVIAAMMDAANEVTMQATLEGAK